MAPWERIFALLACIALPEYQIEEQLRLQKESIIFAFKEPERSG